MRSESRSSFNVGDVRYHLGTRTVAPVEVSVLYILFFVLSPCADTNFLCQVETGFDTSDEVVRETRQVEMSMAPNPSHLEAVNSVVAGMVRSKQMRVDTGRAGRSRVSQRKVMGECPYASPFHTQIPNYHPITDQSLTNY